MRVLRERIRNFNLKRGERFRIGGWRKRKIIYIFIHLYTEIERKGDVVSVYVCVCVYHYPLSSLFPGELNTVSVNSDGEMCGGEIKRNKCCYNL